MMFFCEKYEMFALTVKSAAAAASMDYGGRFLGNWTTLVLPPAVVALGRYFVGTRVSPTGGYFFETDGLLRSGGGFCWAPLCVSPSNPSDLT